MLPLVTQQTGPMKHCDGVAADYGQAAAAAADGGVQTCPLSIA
jgi:hypothetical protein